ncbi:MULTISPECIES: Lrp/AsnC family transcriptional regulator [Lactiplantibacillus]|uniref:Lrp/AsnC family transcriptional regulator n=1 Tax=Lactiplantibacillus TaxID=2767842 RepID=UPI0002BE5369|nr:MULTISPECIES: Lrp/AsnC family transcriptional regulator [Lactiplantibacillus]AGL64820.2 Transcription regulator, AsnC-type [Lactiplantibacillus plantarum subsp. plantarum P-8]AGO08677.1 AsnC family transcriptional regulator [Lactiplantibacillus plantarum 16]APB84586.1 AsnC family transcriptional regulator [Lactiplantibacillus plantarum]AQY70144.1 AsnC family transcriptional regulator [Lactiplantibacillus plantarum]ASD31910.1 Lrp/AsnC family transcriptional regulator [Lactiplantibacillus pla
MDKTDLKILNALQADARISLKALADQCFISSPAISARITRLKKSGIIRDYQANLNFEKLNYHIKAYIQLQLEPTQKERFYPFVAGIPNILECDCVTGEYSQILKVIFESTQALDEFVNQLQTFGKTSTQIVFSTSVPNRGLTLPDDHDMSKISH